MSRPDLLAVLPQLIAERIHERLPGLAQCEGSSGRLDLAELQTTSFRAPAVVVAILGSSARRTLSGPFHIHALRMAAFVLTRSTADLDRHAAAGAIVQALLIRASGASWGVDPGVGPAEDLASQSLTGAAVKAKGVALWAVTWTQPVTLEPLPAQETVPIEIYVGQAPRVGIDHEDDYRRMGAWA